MDASRDPAAVRSFDRRSFLRGTAAAAAAGLLCRPGRSAESPLLAADTPPPRFVHRAMNGWITDLATEPDPRAAWPSMRLDQRLLADYREMFAVMRRVGFNEIVIGASTSRTTGPRRSGAPCRPRGRLVERLIDAGPRRGDPRPERPRRLQLGLRPDHREHPELAGTNPTPLCPRKPASQEWMARVVDFVLDRFEIDGVSMQSADQGRCKCPGCAALGDARLPRRAAPEDGGPCPRPGSPAPSPA